MKLEGRRESQNVDDRRSMSGGAKAGLGVGGVIIVALISLLLGRNPQEVLQYAEQTTTGGTESEYVPTEQEEAMAKFAKQILAGTEDVWTALFKKMGKTYTPPKMVLFRNAVTSGCGNATSSTGPFYCSADQTVYIDLSFFDEMAKKYSAGGDFAYAYVIAHEVGHHVQNQLGILPQVQAQQQRMSQKEANKLNVRLELQADFFAGIWAHYDDKMYNSLEDGDIEEGLNAASQIGDDRLQMKAQGYTVPESFNHGTSSQRSKWLKKGYVTGDVSAGDALYTLSYENL